MSVTKGQDRQMNSQEQARLNQVEAPKRIDWVEEAYSTLELKDKRLTRRAKVITRAMSKNPTGSIPEFSGDWGTTKATYRFFDNEKGEASQLIKAQREGTLARMREHRLVLCLHDSTDVSLSHYPSIKGKGPLPRGKGNRRGLLAHNTLAVSEEGEPLGLLAQRTWVRSFKKKSKAEQRKLPIEKKESYKWLQAVTDSTEKGVPPETKLLFVSDRESDVMEYFLQERAPSSDILLRAAQNRRIEKSEQLLWANLALQPVVGTVDVQIGRRGKQPRRVATCQLRFRQVTIAPPNSNRTAESKLKPVTINAVYVNEINTPDKVTPICWKLLTSVSVLSFNDAQRIVKFYALRWLVERFHFVLKSGCALEKRRLTSIEAIERLLAISNLVAWRLLWLTYAARARPLALVTEAFSTIEWQVLYRVHHKTSTLPPQLPSLHEAALWLACLGGFLARSTDGPPGVKVLWRGWKSLQDQVALYEILFPPPPDVLMGKA